MKANFLITFFVCLINLTSFGQAPGRSADNGRISGTVLDGETNTPVEFATIALHDASDKVVNGTVADDKGKFTITKIADGTYSVVISFIGYETQTVSGLTIAGKDNDIDLGVIKLSTGSKILSEVVVEGKKELIEERVDRTIYNAEQDATTKGGDATDVLKRVPMLSVDLDGNVSLRGSENITVLINNKPSSIMASSIADALKQIPADQIKTVEVITSPSAKYDAEGSGGIINIVTKKNTLEGLTLNVDTGVGNRGANLGLNGNYRKKKMGFSLGGWGRANYNVSGSFESDQTTYDSETGDQFRTLQYSENLNDGVFGNYSLGWDYDINKKNSLAANVRFGVRNNNTYQDNFSTESFLNGSPSTTSLREAETNGLSNSVDINFGYTHLYDKPQQELSIVGLYSRSNNNDNFSNTVFVGNSAVINERIKNENEALNEEFTIQVDYVLPVGAKQLFEVGTKHIQRKAISDFIYFRAAGPNGEFVEDSDAALNNQLNYNQRVSAGYATYTYTTQKSFSFKGGLRYEYTVIDAFSRTEANIDIPRYPVLVPSLNVSKKLKSGNTVKASYNRRIQRPSIRFLNPNIQASNPLNISYGNPELDPEYTNNYELGYSMYIKGTSVNLTGFYRNSDNSIQSVRSFSGATIISTYQNIGKEDTYGSSLFIGLNLGKLSLNGGGDVYYVTLDNNSPDATERIKNNGWVASGRVFGSYTLEKGWAVQGFGFMRGNRIELQGYQGGFRYYSVGIRKNFTNKKGSVGFSAENFLAASMKIRSSLETTTIQQSSLVVRNNLGFRINFSYRIGKMSFDNQPRRRRSINNDDLKDGGDMSGGDMGSGQPQGGGNTGGQSGGAPAGARPAVTAPVAIAAANPDAVVKAEGKWAYTLQSPQGGTGTITITKEGDVYSGIINNNRMPKDIPLTTVTVKGDELTFTYDVAFGGNTTTIQVKAIISGNDMSGNMSLGQFGTFPITAKRGE
jgi:outer membrane receptor protein involved in Fe transport